MTEEPDHRDASPEAAPSPDLPGRLDALDRKVDTLAGAMAAVAATQTELLDLSRHALQQASETAAANLLAGRGLPTKPSRLISCFKMCAFGSQWRQPADAVLSTIRSK